MVRITTQDFQFYRGDTQPLSVVFTTATGEPVDITDHVLWFTMKRAAKDLDGEAVIQKRLVCPSGAQSVAGIGIITLTSVETGAFDPGLYVYDIQRVITETPPVVYTLTSGRISVLEDITRSAW
ncbi:MAG: hypothetical protein HQL95_00740 [Magnetococcales bacterium]|nr:hypothetical protein [Magnetococcales bacterium]